MKEADLVEVDEEVVMMEVVVVMDVVILEVAVVINMIILGVAVVVVVVEVDLRVEVVMKNWLIDNPVHFNTYYWLDSDHRS